MQPTKPQTLNQEHLLKVAKEFGLIGYIDGLIVLNEDRTRMLNHIRSVVLKKALGMNPRPQNSLELGKIAEKMLIQVKDALDRPKADRTKADGPQCTFLIYMMHDLEVCVSRPDEFLDDRVLNQLKEAAA